MLVQVVHLGREDWRELPWLLCLEHYHRVVIRFPLFQRGPSGNRSSNNRLLIRRSWKVERHREVETARAVDHKRRQGDIHDRKVHEDIELYQYLINALPYYRYNQKKMQ